MAVLFLFMIGTVFQDLGGYCYRIVALCSGESSRVPLSFAACFCFCSAVSSTDYGSMPVAELGKLGGNSSPNGLGRYEIVGASLKVRRNSILNDNANPDGKDCCRNEKNPPMINLTI